MVMEVAMKAQQFQQRRLLIDGSWNWLLMEFASYYGVSPIYTKLRCVKATDGYGLCEIFHYFHHILSLNL